MHRDSLLLTCSTAHLFSAQPPPVQISPVLGTADPSVRSTVQLLPCSSVLGAAAACAMTEAFPRGYVFLADQLDRASVSIAANIAEGNGHGRAGCWRVPDSRGSAESVIRCGDAWVTMASDSRRP
jgi:hypothetical protein